MADNKNAMGKMIGGFILIVFGLSLLPTVFSMTSAALTVNITGDAHFTAAVALTYLISLFYVVGVIFAGLEFMGIVEVI